MPRRFVLATQNPFEFEGTYALPESQLDRFMLRVTIGYPPRAAERQLLEDHRTGEPAEQMTSVVSVEEILRLQASVRDVRVDDGVADYLLDIVHATREHPELEVGVSTRGGLMLYRAAQAVALLRGRDFTVPDDVKEMVVPVLAHRIVGKSFMHGNMLAAATNVLTNVIEDLLCLDSDELCDILNLGVFGLPGSAPTRKADATMGLQKNACMPGRGRPLDIRALDHRLDAPRPYSPRLRVGWLPRRSVGIARHKSHLALIRR